MPSLPAANQNTATRVPSNSVSRHLLISPRFPASVLPILKRARGSCSVRYSYSSSQYSSSIATVFVPYPSSCSMIFPMAIAEFCISSSSCSSISVFFSLPRNPVALPLFQGWQPFPASCVSIAPACYCRLSSLFYLYRHFSTTYNYYLIPIFFLILFCFCR